MIFIPKITLFILLTSITVCINGKYIRNKRSNEVCSRQNDKFKCDSGECISLFVVCDGTANCSDKSDETADRCRDSEESCRSDQFECGYGACIPINKKCNKAPDCVDGSDEDIIECGYNKNLINDTCKIYHGKHLEIYHESDNTTIITNPNDSFEKGDLIYYKCEEGFHLFGFERNVCELNSTWRHQIPICEKRCPKIPIDNLAYRISTELGEHVKYEDYMRPGTKLKLECEIGYYEKYPGYNTKREIVCRESGQWSANDVIVCEPICGEYEEHGNVYIMADPLNKIVPWNVGIYKIENADSVDHICGGTIVSTRIVVTAAHCFETRNKANYMVAAGKYFRDFNHPNETRPIQKFNLTHLFIHPEYQRGIYKNDIAFLVLDKHVVYRLHISPVCIDWNMNLDRENVNIQGFVAGWGWYTNTHLAPSTVLRGADFRIAKMEKCTESDRNAYTEDKICVGGASQNAVCKGDSGAGYVTNFGNNKMSLLGIVSYTSQKDQCFPHGFSLMTNIEMYFSNLTNMIEHYKNKNIF